MNMGDTSVKRGGETWELADGSSILPPSNESAGQKKTARVKKFLFAYLAGFYLGMVGVMLPDEIAFSSRWCPANFPLFLIQQIIQESFWVFLVWGLPFFLALAYVITAPIPRRGRWLLLWVACLGMTPLVPYLLRWIPKGPFGELFGRAWVIGGNFIVAILTALYLWAYNQSPAGHPEAASGRGQWSLAPADRLGVMWTVFKASLALVITHWVLNEWTGSLCQVGIYGLFIFPCTCTVGDWSWVITAGTGSLALVLGVGMPVFACLKWWVEPRTRALLGARTGRPARVRLRRAWIVLGATTGCGVLIIILAGSFYDFQGLIAWGVGLFLFLTGGILPLALILHKFEPTEGRENTGQE